MFSGALPVANGWGVGPGLLNVARYRRVAVSLKYTTVAVNDADLGAPAVMPLLSEQLAQPAATDDTWEPVEWVDEAASATAVPGAIPPVGLTGSPVPWRFQVLRPVVWTTELIAVAAGPVQTVWKIRKSLDVTDARWLQIMSREQGTDYRGVLVIKVTGAV